MKGSKYAILKFVESSDFLDCLNNLIKSTNANLTTYDNWMPKSIHYDKEAELKDFLKYNFSSELGNKITDWWLFTDATTPNWDLITTCTINGKKGLVLVEAKAHVDELLKESKGKNLDPKASENSIKNHEQIAIAIKEVNNEINKEISGVNISIGKCYQLSNRIAHAWWLANQGIPVVLMYLGFLNCEDMNNGKNNLFKMSKDWEDCFINHSKIVEADKLIDKTINCGKSSFVMICKSINSKK